MERLTPLASQDRNQLLELLLAQSDLDSLLATFADHAARVVRIHSLYFDHAQSLRLIQQPPQANLTLHSYPFELRGQHGQLFGQLHYTLEHTLSGSQQEEGYCFRVTDCGPGIPDYARERLFERFYRVDTARSRQLGGTEEKRACDSIL